MGGKEIDAAVAAVHAKLVNNCPIETAQVKQQTRRDAVLSRVLQFVLTSWPLKSPDGELHPYWQRRDELTVEEIVILWGLRLVVPIKLR